MNGLDSILHRASHLPVLRILHQATGPVTGREIQRQTGLSNRATMMALDALVQAGVATRDTARHAHGYRINHRHYVYAEALASAFRAEARFWDDVRKLIRRVVQPRPAAAVATGPLARNAALSSGVLELTLVFSSERSRQRAVPCLQRLTEAVRERYALGLEVQWLNGRTAEQEDAARRQQYREGACMVLFGEFP